MSYQLLIFDNAAAPRDRLGCLAWCSHQTRRSEGGEGNDPNALAPALRAWFIEMIAIFPPRVSALESGDDREPRQAVFRLGRSVICAAFAWSESEMVFRAAQDLAVRHGVGLVEASLHSAEIWRPQAKRVPARSIAE